MKYIVLISFFLFSGALLAQKNGVSGTVINEKDGNPLTGATVLIYNYPDSTITKGSVSDEKGNFLLEALPKGACKLRISFIGYTSYATDITLSNKIINIGVVKLTEETEVLKEVNVQSTQIRAQQKGDTTEYNANAYKVNADADAQQLVTKMPNINMENGKVKAQGEDVKKVLIDGKEFFGDDATLALRSLPAEVIDKIQVFDRMSEQSRFTGFSDGNDQKTLNIVTKSGKSNGQFGKIYAGYGTNNRYWAGGNVNLFKGDRRISVLALTNNINQQNFDTQDLLGVFGNQGRSSGGGGGWRSGTQAGGRPSGGGGGWRGGSSDMNNFLIGQQGGISAATALGINYVDKWGKNIAITGNYFFNYSDNTNSTSLVRNFVSSNATAGQIYSENNAAETKNINHRLSMRMELTIDSANSVVLSPRLNLQGNKTSSDLLGENNLSGSLLNQTNNLNTTNYNGYNFSNDLLFRHKFSKQGRTVSVNFATELNSKTGNTSLESESQYYTIPDTTITIAQQADIANNSRTLSGNITYTEPVGKKGQLQLSYNPSYNSSLSDKKTFNLDALSNEYNIPDVLLTNKYDNTYQTHRGGLSYRFNTERVNLMAGVNYQYALLKGEQVFPPLPLQLGKIEKTFSNLLPTAMYQYKFTGSTNIRFYYRSSTSPPSVTQLQNVVDNSNPLLLSIGNPNLRQNFSQMLVTRFSHANTTNGRSFFAFVFTSNTANYIGNSTLIALSDTTLFNNVTLFKGAQLNKPVNLNGYWNMRSFLTYGLPVKPLKSNLNLNAGFTYNRTPGLVNTQTNNANTYNVNAGLVLGSNINEKIDFTVSYSANYNIVNNSILPELNNNYFFQQAGARLSWQFWKGFVLNTDVNESLYTGLDATLNQQFVLWNAGLAYKFLNNQAAEIQLKVYDLLNQNNSITRNVTETYVEDTQTEVLQRYAMLTFTYNLRNFKASQKSDNTGSGSAAGSNLQAK